MSSGLQDQLKRNATTVNTSLSHDGQAAAGQRGSPKSQPELLSLLSLKVTEIFISPPLLYISVWRRISGKSSLGIMDYHTKENKS